MVSIIAGPFETWAEAEALAIKYARDFAAWKAAKLAEIEGIVDPLDKAVAARAATKYIEDCVARYEVVAHLPGGIP